MKENDYFCYEIYKNIAVWSKNGKIGYNPCSFFNGYIKETDRIDLGDVWHQKEHKSIMLQVETNQPVPGCRTCYGAEKSGLVSRRIGSKQLYEEFHQDTELDLSGPQGMDYSVGNLCNLKCIICGPENSTAWVPDYQKLNPGAPIEKYNKNFQLTLSDTKFLKNITSIHFHGGGEPLLSNHHIELLTKVKEAKGLSDVRVFYNTNGTVRASDQLMSLWEECKLIELYFSIDDVGNRFNYQRTGADWTKVQENLEWYKQSMPHNHMFNINCVWSYLNLYYLNELVDWYKTYFVSNRYGDPTNLIFQKAIGRFSINHISMNVCKQLLDRFDNYPELCALVNSLTIDNHRDHSNFLYHVNRIDDIRGNQFKDLCPEWRNLL
jgi:MoaA/NifB/PqqE/SkfB family radical SAM enzyme